MERNKHLMLEERARVTEIQDLLIDRYVEQKEALEEGKRCRAIGIQHAVGKAVASGGSFRVTARAR